MQDIPAAMVLGCRVDALTCEAAINRIVELAREDEASQIVTLGTEMVVRAQDDPSFLEILNDSALSLCDTVGVLYAARLHNIFVPELVTGIDLIDPLCQALAAEDLSVFFLGAQGDTAERVGRSAIECYPNLRVAGCAHGYFSPNQDADMAAKIAQTGADVLLVGMGSPRQEYWIAHNLPETGCRVGIGVGGSFDVLAGNVKRASSLWRKLHLEWLYRLIREPRRWRRQLALPRFVWLALRDAIMEDREKLRT